MRCSRPSSPVSPPRPSAPSRCSAALALLGDGIGHVAVTGVAIGLLTGTSPVWTAVLVAILGAVAIEAIRELGHTNGDVALALLFYGGLAGGVLITGLAGQGANKLHAYLFGSITSLSDADVWFTIGLGVCIVAITLGLLPQLFAVASDPEFAKVAGLRVRSYNLLVAVLAAVTVTVAMRTVGLLPGLGPDGRAGRHLPAAGRLCSGRRWQARWVSAARPRSVACSSPRPSRSASPSLRDPRSCCWRWPCSPPPADRCVATAPTPGPGPLPRRTRRRAGPPSHRERARARAR
ncbi:metal ABC transporter permease [Nocardioides sp. B-3]|uniref:metal ABC transporter permease n=1 Tax=Nocardioides sp. B-3 TaxID=2895565 RepID=UPI00300E3A12